MTTVNIPQINLQEAFTKKRLTGLWRLLKGYRAAYLIATISIGIAAMSRAGTYLLLQKFVDGLTGESTQTWPLPLVALSFVLLAVLTGGFSFVSGALTARTSEGIAKRVRDYMYDQIQRMLQSLQSSPQFLTVDHISIEGEEGATSTQLQIAVHVTTYLAEADQALLQKLTSGIAPREGADGQD